jgi:nuclear cap-binding protein subunit 1
LRKKRHTLAQTVPARDEPDGIFIRSLILSLIDVYEVNRKEAAKVLLELPRWLATGTFKPKGGANADDEAATSTWVLEHVIVEVRLQSLSSRTVLMPRAQTILTSLFALPSTKYKAVYYHSLVVELCKLSPATVAPAMGKCVRRLYAGLGASPNDSLALEPEVARRFADWFAVHLSNFGFSWRWSEWEGDLSLPAAHPKRAFIDRLLELEVRLSYFDRIKGTLPDAYKSGGFMAGEAPAPHFTYDDAGAWSGVHVQEVTLTGAQNTNITSRR